MTEFDPTDGAPIHVHVDDSAVAPLIDGYLVRRRAELDQIREAIDTQDLARLRSIGHNLHGSGGAYCLDQLSAFGKAMEDAAEEGDAARLAQLVDAIGIYLDRLVIDVATGA